MPEKLHKALEKTAKKKGLKGKDFERYVYGGLVNFEKKRNKSVAVPENGSKKN